MPGLRFHTTPHRNALLFSNLLLGQRSALLLAFLFEIPICINFMLERKDWFPPKHTPPTLSKCYTVNCARGTTAPSLEAWNICHALVDWSLPGEGTWGHQQIKQLWSGFCPICGCSRVLSVCLGPQTFHSAGGRWDTAMIAPRVPLYMWAVSRLHCQLCTLAFWAQEDLLEARGRQMRGAVSMRIWRRQGSWGLTACLSPWSTTACIGCAWRLLR